MGYPEARLDSPTSIKITEQEPQEPPALSFYWKTGVLKKIYLQAQALDLFEEKLLEGDTKPEEIFRRLHRALIQNIFFLCLNALYLCLLGLCLLNFSAKHSFLNKLSTFLLLSSAIFLSADLFLLYYRGMMESISGNFFISIIDSAGILLLFFSIFVLLCQFISNKIKGSQKVKDSQRELRKSETRDLHLFPVKGKALFLIVFHFFLICAAALLLANFFLFPLYSLQLSFPNFFALFLFLLVLLIVAYYTYAYWHVLSRHKAKSNLAIALAFLAYRLLHNVIFLFSVFIVIGLLAGSIVLISAYNVDILRSLKGY